MRVLIDECAPRALKTFLSKEGHECRTVQEAGWAGKVNGELLGLAEDAFDCAAYRGHKPPLPTKPHGPQDSDSASSVFFQSVGPSAPILPGLRLSPQDNQAGANRCRRRDHLSCLCGLRLIQRRAGIDRTLNSLPITIAPDTTIRPRAGSSVRTHWVWRRREFLPLCSQ